MNPGFCWRRWAIAGCGILCLVAVSARAQVDRATVSHGAAAAAEIKAAAAKPTPRAVRPRMLKSIRS